MRTKIVVAVVLVVVIIASIATLYILSIGIIGPYNSCLPAFCSMQSGMQDGQYLIFASYNFPVDGPLTVNFINGGAAVENLAGAQYFVCPQDSSSCVQGTLGNACSNASHLAPEASCQVAITLSVTSLVSGASYTFKVITPTGGVFHVLVNYGGYGGNA